MSDEQCEGQSTIFDHIDGLPDARMSDHDTSWNAAAANREVRKGQQKIVLNVLNNAGPDGLTDSEIATIGNLHPGSAAKRRLDLERAGLVFNTTRKRKVEHHNQAIVWSTTKPERNQDNGQT
jgi:hypothetical protein